MLSAATTSAILENIFAVTRRSSYHRITAYRSRKYLVAEVVFKRFEYLSIEILPLVEERYQNTADIKLFVYLRLYELYRINDLRDALKR